MRRAESCLGSGAAFARSAHLELPFFPAAAHARRSPIGCNSLGAGALCGSATSDRCLRKVAGGGAGVDENDTALVRGSKDAVSYE